MCYLSYMYKIIFLIFLYSFSALSSFQSETNFVISDEIFENSKLLKEEIELVISSARRRERRSEKYKVMVEIADLLSNVAFSKGASWCTNHPGGLALGYAFKHKNRIFLCNMFFNTLEAINISINKKKSREVFIRNVILHEILHVVGYSHNSDMYKMHNDIITSVSTQNLFDEYSHSKLSSSFVNDIASGYNLLKKKTKLDSSHSNLVSTISSLSSYSYCHVFYIVAGQIRTSTNFVLTKVDTDKGVVYDMVLDNDNVKDLLVGINKRATLISSELNKTKNNIFDEYYERNIDLTKVISLHLDGANDYFKVKYFNVGYKKLEARESQYVKELRFFSDGIVELKGDYGLAGYGYCK